MLAGMERTILVVDDDPHIRQVLVFALGKAGLAAIEAEDGEQAIARITADAPDLVILDINMPRMDGLEVCRRVRATSAVPILFLSSRDDEIDRVLGIELGADDYVVKPFSPREVVARTQAILRRAAGGAGAVAGVPAGSPPDQVKRVRIGCLRLDTESWRATWDDREVALTVTEFTLLCALAARPGKVFSRDEIIDRLHGPGFAVTDRTIDSHIRNLRAKFAAVGGESLIETRPGIGYAIGPCTGSGTA